MLNKITVGLRCLGSKNPAHEGVQLAQTEVSVQKKRATLSEVVSIHEMQLSFESLAARYISGVFKIKEDLSRGQIIGVTNELAPAGTKL